MLLLKIMGKYILAICERGRREVVKEMNYLSASFSIRKS